MKFLYQIELPISLIVTHKSTQSEIDDNIVQRTLENRIEKVKTQKSGWKFPRTNTIEVPFYKSGKIIGSSYDKNPSKNSAFINIKNDDKYCFVWSMLDNVHPCDNNTPNRVSIYRQYCRDLNTEGFDFTNRFKCSDMHKFDRLNNLSTNIYDIKFCQDDNQGKHKLIPIEISKKATVNRVFDLLV